MGAVGVLAAASLGSLAGAGPALAAGTPSGSTPLTTRVVASHLNTPKYLTFGRGGLYVAVSGSGGRRCVSAIGTTGAPTPVCEGATGSVLRIDRAGRSHTVLRGLASSVQRSNGEVEGPIAVTFDGRRPVALERGAYVGPTGQSALPGRLGREFGKLIAATPHRVGARLNVLADFGRFAEQNPQSGATLGGLPGEIVNDTDAHDVVAYHGGWAVADAGANDVIWVHRGGAMSVIARLPTQTETAPAGALGPGSPALTVQAQSVPSSLTVGPDGALYVGILRGVPSLPGTAQVYRVVPGQTPVAVVTGLSRVSDVAFAKSGKLLVLESSAAGGTTTPTSQGELLEATLDGSTPVQATNTGLTGLVDPTGLAVGPAGRVYITNDTGTLGAGQVLQVTGLQ